MFDQKSGRLPNNETAKSSEFSIIGFSGHRDPREGAKENSDVKRTRIDESENPRQMKNAACAY